MPIPEVSVRAVQWYSTASDQERALYDRISEDIVRQRNYRTVMRRAAREGLTAGMSPSEVATVEQMLREEREISGYMKQQERALANPNIPESLRTYYTRYSSLPTGQALALWEILHSLTGDTQVHPTLQAFGSQYGWYEVQVDIVHPRTGERHTAPYIIPLRLDAELGEFRRRMAWAIGRNLGVIDTDSINSIMQQLEDQYEAGELDYRLRYIGTDPQ